MGCWAYEYGYAPLEHKAATANVGEGRRVNVQVEQGEMSQVVDNKRKANERVQVWLY